MATPLSPSLQDLEAALMRDPRRAESWTDYGKSLWQARRVAEALASFDSALALAPKDAGALMGRGDALAAIGRHAEAVVSFDGALAEDAGNAAAWRNRGTALRTLKRYDEALASYDRAVALAADDTAALYERGQLQWIHFRRFELALADLARVVALDPAYPYALGDLVHLRMHIAAWQDIEGDIARIADGVRAGARVATPFVFQALSGSPADLHRCAVTYARDQYPAAGTQHRRGGTRAKIRVGYVSGEFYEQATAYLTVGLFEQHDKSKFEIVAFDNGMSDGGPTRTRLEAAIDRFVDIAALSDGAAAERIAGEDIDILVNLNGYFGEGRMGVFAQRPAPVQVNYLGFPGTLGADYMDYILADRVVIPETERGFYSEQVVYLPGSYQANDSRRAIADAAPARGAFGLPERGFVFCNFNQSYKLTPDIFAVWTRILRAVDGSVLWLWETGPAVARNLRAAAADAGVAPERLVFAAHLPAAQHLARLRLADLVLDTLPYNAHTSASDALWAGAPVLTCRGTAFAGRVAASLLMAVGLSELVTESLHDYESLAIKLARDAALIGSMRAKLAINRDTAPLFDTGGFRKAIEAAFTTMVEIHRRGEAPRGFSVG